jgi:hypothetical protein
MKDRTTMTTAQLEAEREEIDNIIADREEANEERVESLNIVLHPLGFNARAPYFDSIGLALGVNGAGDFKKFPKEEFLGKDDMVDTEKLLVAMLLVIRRELTKGIQTAETELTTNTVVLQDRVKTYKASLDKCEELLSKKLYGPVGG